MLFFNDLSQLLSSKTEAISEWFHIFKKTKAFKITAASLALAIAILYGFGLYCNHKRLERFAPEKKVYHMGDRIAFGENYMGMYTTANGYYVTFTEAYAVDFDEFVSESDLDRSQIISWLAEDSTAKISPLPYLIVVNAVFENESCTEDWDTCLDNRNFILYSADWYGYNLMELSHFFNEELENSYFIFAPPGDEVNVTMVFGFSEKSFSRKTWENINKKDVRLNLTYGTQKIDVKLDIEKKKG